MTNINQTDVESVLNKQRKFKITLGSTIGVILMLYFFSFATLLDKAPRAFFDFEMISGLVMVVILFTLNKISFSFTKKRFARRPEYRSWINKLRQDDIDKNIETVLSEIERR